MQVSPIKQNKTSFRQISITKPAQNFLRENLGNEDFEKFVKIQKAEAKNPLTEVFIALVGETDWFNKHDLGRIYMKVSDKLFFARKNYSNSHNFFEQLDTAIKYSNRFYKLG